MSSIFEELALLGSGAGLLISVVTSIANSLITKNHWLYSIVSSLITICFCTIAGIFCGLFVLFALMVISETVLHIPLGAEKSLLLSSLFIVLFIISVGCNFVSNMAIKLLKSIKE